MGKVTVVYDAEGTVVAFGLPHTGESDEPKVGGAAAEQLEGHQTATFDLPAEFHGKRADELVGRLSVNVSGPEASLELA